MLNINLSDLLPLALLTFYLSYAITASKGPFAVFERLREHFPLGGLTTCFVCLSVWVSLGSVLLLHIVAQRPLLAEDIVLGIAAAGGALFLWKWTGGSYT